jgi:hypothetical protein
MTSDVIVTMEHVRKAQMCSRGSRKFFERHNLDWNDFLLNGIPASKLIPLNDAMANEVVEIAYGRK